MLCDEAFYNPSDGSYRIEAFLSDGIRQVGGYDSIVLWHAYPRIGLDDRNQFDFYRDMPGGLRGLRTVADVCHKRGVRVFVDYNPWDRGTRPEGISDLDALASLVAAIDADGIFLDTMKHGASAFRATLDHARAGVVLESEGALPLENIAGHHMSWAQWFPESWVPGVLRNKWFERRHMQHQIRRWDRDHSSELHAAWMNGSGILIWENVFGSWVGWNGRDRSILRAMLPIQRRYRRLFSGEGWTPLVSHEQPGLYASLWEGDGVRLWTLVNRSQKEVRGTLLKTESREGVQYFDLIAGRELGPGPVITGAIRPRGIGAVVAAKPEALGRDWSEFLASQREIEQRTGSITAFPARTVALRPITPTLAAPVPSGMVEIAPSRFHMKVRMRVRECGFYESQSDISLTSPSLHEMVWFERTVQLDRYAIDLTPVTNAQYAAFLKAGGYQPRFTENFLKHWSNRAPPPGKEDHPVVYVDLEDARAYARWAGKRLPREEEWQYAAEGDEQRLYPWGDEMKPGMCNDGATPGTTSVTRFPAGRSPFGCYDMCGNTWEWTESERSDGRTRFAMIRGGSWFQARGSEWYMDGGPQPSNFSQKFLLLWPGLDRCATIGFRCVVDLG
jgi:formylglycine-generating enzyme required for sulfatase activity